MNLYYKGIYMIARPDPYSVLAVDGGGTRCRLVLDGPDGRKVVEAGSANVTSDFEAAIAEIDAGITALAEAAGLARESLLALPTYLGLAGVSDEAMAARVADALPLAHVRVEEDWRAALRGALGPRDGALAHCGTGSFFSIQVGDKVRSVGGWGSRLGDEASAFWVARAALTATLEVADGLAAPTGLTDAVLARFGTPGGIVAHAAKATPGEIAEIAPLVTAAAEAGDPMARAILQSGADHIARVLGKIGWRPGMALCLTGGIGPAYRPFLPAELRAALVEPAGKPIDGAVALARAFAEEAAR